MKLDTNSTSPKLKPVHEIRLGRVKAAFWEHPSDEPDRPPNVTVTFSRLYKNEEGQWRSSSGFFKQDLLLLAKLADAAHSHVCAPDGE